MKNYQKILAAMAMFSTLNSGCKKESMGVYQKADEKNETLLSSGQTPPRGSVSPPQLRESQSRPRDGSNAQGIKRYIPGNSTPPSTKKIYVGSPNNPNAPENRANTEKTMKEGMKQVRFNLRNNPQRDLNNNDRARNNNNTGALGQGRSGQRYNSPSPNRAGFPGWHEAD